MNFNYSIFYKYIDDNIDDIKSKIFTMEGFIFFCDYFKYDYSDIHFENVNLKYNKINDNNYSDVNKIKYKFHNRIRRIIDKKGSSTQNVLFICGLQHINPDVFYGFSSYNSEFTFFIKNDIDYLYYTLKTFVQDSSDNYSENSYILIPLVIHNYTGSILYLSSQPKRQRVVQYKAFFNKYSTISVSQKETSLKIYEDCGYEYKQSLDKFKLMCNQLFVQNKKMLLNDISKWNEFKNADKIKNVKEIIDKNLNIEK